VPSVRTVVVLPAPFGPRKPNTSRGVTIFLLALGLAAGLLAVDLLAWRIVAAMFDRERLVTGTRG